MGLTLTACTHIYFRSFVLELDATSLFFSIQPLDRPTPAVVCLWPCPNPETNPSTTPIPLTPPISPLPILSTMSTRAWAIATRSLWPPTPTHGLRALAACYRLKARRARMVFRSRYLSVCLFMCLPAPTTPKVILEVFSKMGSSNITIYSITYTTIMYAV